MKYILQSITSIYSRFVTRYALIIIIAMLISGCHHNQEKSFNDLSSAFIEWYLKSNPTMATELGYHEFDNDFESFDKDYLKATLADLKRFDLELTQIDRAALDLDGQVDYELISATIERLIFESDTRYKFAQNPFYFQQLIQRSLAVSVFNTDFPMSNRVTSIISRLEKIPEFIVDIQSLISETTELLKSSALEQLKLNISLIQELPLQVTADDFTLDRLDGEIEKSILMLYNHQDWLENIKVIDEPIIKPEIYRQKFEFEVTDQYSPEEFLLIAQDQLINVQDRIFDLLYPAYLVENDEPVWVNRNDTLHVIDWGLTKYLDAVNGENELKDNIPKILQGLISNLKVNNLIPLRDNQPIIVYRNLSIGEMDRISLSPYNLLTDSERKLISVGLPPVNDMDRKQEYFEGFDIFDLTIWCMREVYPGSFTLSSHISEQSSIIRQLFSNTAMQNGWSLYAADMLLGAGFGQADFKYELRYLQQIITILAGTIAEIRLNIVSEAETVISKYLSDQVYLNDYNFQRLLKSITLSPCKLPAELSGLNELLETRNIFEEKAGSKFNIKTFHSIILDTGPISKSQFELLYN